MDGWCGHVSISFVLHTMQFGLGWWGARRCFSMCPLAHLNPKPHEIFWLCPLPHHKPYKRFLLGAGACLHAYYTCKEWFCIVIIFWPLWCRGVAYGVWRYGCQCVWLRIVWGGVVVCPCHCVGRLEWLLYCCFIWHPFEPNILLLRWCGSRQHCPRPILVHLEIWRDPLTWKGCYDCWVSCIMWVVAGMWGGMSNSGEGCWMML